MKMNEPVVAQKSPLSADVEAGKTYFSCTCGQSQKQPFCDGSHKTTGFSPLKFAPAESDKVFFCCCKKTGNPPFCDGTHKNL